MSKRNLIKNAAANLLSGFSGALLAVVLPPLLVRTLSHDTYSAWVLILQVGAYANLLGFGLQTAVGRFVAHARETGDTEKRDGIVSTALLILTGSALVAIFALWVVSHFVPDLFPKLPQSLQASVSRAILLIGGSIAMGLPFSVYTGLFVGLQRNEVPAALQIFGRTLLGVSVVVAAKASGGDLGAMSKAYAAASVVMYGAQWSVARLWAGPMRRNIFLATKTHARELVRYCFSLTVWSLAMLLVSGADLVLVAWLDFPKVGSYGIASNLLMLFYGFQGAIFNVLIPESAKIHAQGDEGRLTGMLVRTTRYNLLLMAALTLAYFPFRPWLLQLYVGSAYGHDVRPILDVLLVAGVVRLSMTPYNMLAIGTGDHKRIVVSPVLEGISNLILSILLGRWLGAIGIAIGTLLGGIIGAAFHVFYNLPRSPSLPISWRDFLRQAFKANAWVFVPIFVAWGIEATGRFGLSGRIVWPLAALVSVVLIVRSLSPGELRSIPGFRRFQE